MQFVKKQLKDAVLEMPAAFANTPKIFVDISKTIDNPNDNKSDLEATKYEWPLSKAQEEVALTANEGADVIVCGQYRGETRTAFMLKSVEIKRGTKKPGQRKELDKAWFEFKYPLAGINLKGRGRQRPRMVR